MGHTHFDSGIVVFGVWFDLPDDVRVLVLHALIGAVERGDAAVRALYRLAGTCRALRQAVLANAPLWQAVRRQWCRPMPAGRPRRIFDDLCALHAHVEGLAPGLLPSQSASTGFALAADRHAGRETDALLAIKLEVAEGWHRRCERRVRQLDLNSGLLVTHYGPEWFGRLARAYVATRRLPRWNQPGTARCRAADLARMLRMVEQAYPCFDGERLNVGVPARVR